MLSAIGGAVDTYENVGLTFINGGALNGGLTIDDIVVALLDEEDENDRFGSGLLVFVVDDEKHRSGVCNGGRFRRLPCMKAREEL